MSGAWTASAIPKSSSPKIEPEMPKGVEEHGSDTPAGDPAKEKRVDEL